jgi:hypothetical protein
MRRVSGLLLTLVIALTATACDSNHHADISSVTDCLRARHARVVPQPPALEKAALRRGWIIRRFHVSAGNAVTVLATRSDSAARDAYTRATKAFVTVNDPGRPYPQRRARIVYWWDEPPTAAERRLFSRCVRS